MDNQQQPGLSRGVSLQDLVEENERLSEELAQCKADKEFVWSLWKQLQKESPDMVGAVDMVVTREKLKHEQQNKKAVALLQVKNKELAALKLLMDADKTELCELKTRSSGLESELIDLQNRLEAQHLETNKQEATSSKLLIENESLGSQCSQLKKSVEELRQGKEQLACENSKIKQEVTALREKVAECYERIEACQNLEAALKESEEQLAKMREENQLKQFEINELKNDLKASQNSRDTWATHTTLQTSSMQKLQTENGLLKTDIALKEEKLKSLSETCTQLSSELEEIKHGHYASEAQKEALQVPRETDVSQLSSVLEKTEKELFETKALLKAKSEELKAIRYTHDRRLQRMQSLQANHKLVLEQLKTYETKEMTPHKKKQCYKKVSFRELRQENSEAVWNKLAHYKASCEELEKLRLSLEEERDTLHSRYLRSQTTITELRACLQYEKDDLERKISAIAAADPALDESIALHKEIEQLQSKVNELQDENSKLLQHNKTCEKQMFELRQAAAEMQSAIIQQKHASQVRKLKTLSKSTMTDVQPQARDEQLSSDADSRLPIHHNTITAVKPETRDAQVSPLVPLRSLVHGNGVSTTASPHCSSTEMREHFDEGSKSRSDMCKLELEQCTGDKNDCSPKGGKAVAKPTEIRPLAKCIHIVKKHQTPNVIMKDKHPQMLKSHKCQWQQQVKVLELGVKAVTVQIKEQGNANRELKKSLEEERMAAERARNEVKDLHLRLQNCKVTIQGVRAEKDAVSEELQSKIRHLEKQLSREVKKCEPDRKELVDKCASLRTKVKSLESDLESKVLELHCVNENYCKLDRDIKQKRQLIDDLRNRLKRAEELSSKHQSKMESLQSELKKRTDTTQQIRLKMEMVSSQLTKQTQENERVMEMLTKCQEELAHTIEELATSQIRTEQKLSQSHQAKQRCESYVKELQVSNKERVSQLQVCLQEKMDVIKEFQQFVKMLAERLEHENLMRSKVEPNPAIPPFHEEVAIRAREIARASLKLTDGELDCFFSNSVVTPEHISLSHLIEKFCVQELKVPFASKLTAVFVKFITK